MVIFRNMRSVTKILYDNLNQKYSKSNESTSDDNSVMDAFSAEAY